ncbi:threonylcarbamoyl-AMP synthase [bacterium]|nr:threonylcarbamoyl-AMP synthase [bacterium]
MILSADEIGSAVQLLKRGGVIGYPTETVYGVGGRATDADVVQRIRHLKGRPDQKPMLILLPDETAVRTVCRNISGSALMLMRHFWPGPLTLVLVPAEGFASVLPGLEKGIGVRISPDPVCRMLMEDFGEPLISTSANRTGEKPARSAEAVDQIFGPRLDAVIDGGPRNMNSPSTVLDVRSRPFRMLRQGAVGPDQIQKITGEHIVPAIL